MEILREEFFKKSKKDRNSIEWNGEKMRIAKFEDLYLAQCQLEGVIPNEHIKAHFWKNCVAIQGYEPRYCKVNKGIQRD